MFTLNGFDYQERNLTFVKTDFQLLRLKFHAWNFNILFINYTVYRVTLTTQQYFYANFTFGTCMCKRGIRKLVDQ